MLIIWRIKGIYSFEKKYAGGNIVPRLKDLMFTWYYFRRGMRDGEGIETFYNGEKYVGDYREDNKEGQVKQFTAIFSNNL